MNKSVPPSDKEIDAKIKHIEQQHKELEKKIVEAYTALGLTKEELKQLMKDSDNFTAEEWEEFTKERKELVDELGPLLSQEEKKELLGSKEAEKKQKTKPASSRQKWLQM